MAGRGLPCVWQTVMKTPLAILNLWHQLAKTLVSVSGVGFALLLVFMQLGFMGAVSHTATNVLDHLKFDILLRARNYLHLYEPGHIDREWLTLARGTPGVTAAQPLWITVQNWRKLPTARQSERLASFESQYLPIAVMAVEPAADVFDLPEIEALLQQNALHGERSILLDDTTQADYGPWVNGKFSPADLERETEIGGNRFRITGLFRLGTGLAANGAVITSDQGFSKLSPWDVRSTASLGLIQVANPMENVERVAEQLRLRTALPTTARGATPQAEAAPGWLSWWPQRWFGPTPPREHGQVAVLTRAEALQLERSRWLWQTPIGLIFQLGVVLSLLVGAAIVYMVLATDVANRLPEYATLLAIGYSRRYLASIVMTQALALSGLGFLAAWAAAEVLYRLTYAFSSIPLMMEWPRIVLVAALGLLMCCASGLLALRKLWKAEPASLF